MDRGIKPKDRGPCLKNDMSVMSGHVRMWIFVLFFSPSTSLICQLMYLKFVVGNNPVLSIEIGIHLNHFESLFVRVAMSNAAANTSTWPKRLAGPGITGICDL